MSSSNSGAGPIGCLVILAMIMIVLALGTWVVASVARSVLGA